MADEKVEKFRLSASKAQQIVREVAKDANNVDWTNHALEQMDERSIYDVDVLRVLRRGYVDDPPLEGKHRGEWKCKLTLKLKGQRVAGVATAILSNGRLLILTAEWEDEK